MNSILRIPINGKHCLIDEEDKYKANYDLWIDANGYVCFWAGRKRIYLHRQILGPLGNVCVTHINGDRLDNRKANLRVTNRAGIQAGRPKRGTTSKYRGVSFKKGCGKYVVKIGGKWRGQYADEIEAALVADHWTRMIYGRDGRYNFPREGERGELLLEWDAT